jgi:hypothetical protein
MRSLALCVFRYAALLVGAVAIATAPASAQGAVGSGPLTSTLPDKEPQSGVIRLGALRVTPGLTIREIGHDDNVFNEAINPKEDWVVAGRPDILVFARLPLAQIAAYAGSEMQWYNTYESERSIGYEYRGRVDFLLSRLFPFVGGGTTHNRTRPNGEIDVRADQRTDELSGGIGYSLAEHASMFGAAIQSRIRYEDAFEDGVDLSQTLDHRSNEYQGGLKTDLTPLLSLQLRGSYREDKFDDDPTRNGDMRMGSAVFTFDPAAVISGVLSINYQDYQPVDPLVEPFRGVTGSGFITYPLLEIGRFNFGYNRSTEYSFDTREGYYVDNTLRAIYTQRLLGEVDLQGQAARSNLDYGQRAGVAERTDTLETYNGNLGYNLRNRTRVAMNYEYARRRSPAIADRNYIRRRIFLSWVVAF